MDQLPDFWRTEIFHPLSVHFPIALLALGTIFLIFGYFSRKRNISFSAKILLVSGTLAAWISVYTGSLADGIVSRQICDPTVLKDHENGAFAVAWLFTASSALILVDYFRAFRKAQRALQIIIIALTLAGSGFLIYTGHLGAKLVYQQAAGVYKPSDDCSEFNE